MAQKVLTSSGSLTAGGTWARIEARNLAVTTAATGLTTTPVNIPVTFDNNGNQVALILSLNLIYLYAGGAITLTIKLKEGSTERTTDTFPIYADFDGFKRFALTTYAVTTAASTWSYDITATTTGSVSMNYSAGPVYVHAVECDVDATAAVTTDTIIVKDGVTLTADSTWNFGATGYWGLILCSGLTGAGAELSNTNPAAPYTLTFAGNCHVGTFGKVKFGASGTPTSYANRLTIDVSTASAVVTSLFNTASYGSTCQLELYGAEDSYMATTLASQAAASQKVVVTSVDMSSYWAADDYVTFVGKNTLAGDNVQYQIDTVVGTTVTLKTNLDAIVFAGARIMNRTRAFRTLGIYLKGFSNGSITNKIGLAYYDYAEIVGVYSYNVSFSAAGGGQSPIRKKASTTKSDTWRSIMMEKDISNTAMPFMVFTNTGNTTAYGYTISNCHFYSAVASNVACAGIYLISVINATIDNLTVKGGYDVYRGTFAVDATSVNVTANDVIAGHSHGNYYYYPSASILGTKHTFTNCRFGGDQTACWFNCNTSTFTNVSCNKSSYSLYILGGVDNTWTNSSIGGASAGATADIYTSSSIYAKNTFVNCNIGATGLSNVTNMLDGSYFAFHTYDETANDHRVYYKYGELQSTGDGLTDTTVHTAGTGKFATRFKPLSSSNKLDDWVMTIPTGSLLGVDVTVSCWVKINNAAYYATTHQNPTLRVNYDDGTVGTVVATDSTAWQKLVVAFTPTTAFGQILINLDGYTDATGTNAYFYLDDFSGGYLVNGGLDLYANALPVTPSYAFVISAADFWGASNSIDYGTGTMGKHTAKKLLTTAKFIGLK